MEVMENISFAILGLFLMIFIMGFVVGIVAIIESDEYKEIIPSVFNMEYIPIEGYRAWVSIIAYILIVTFFYITGIGIYLGAFCAKVISFLYNNMKKGMSFLFKVPESSEPEKEK